MDHIINIELSMYCVLCKRCVCHARTIWSNLLLKARALQSTATKRFIFARLLFLYNGRVEYNYTTLASSVRWKFFSTLYVLPKRSRFFCEMKVLLHSLRPTETFLVLLWDESSSPLSTSYRNVLGSSVRWKFISTLYVLPKRSRFF